MGGIGNRGPTDSAYNSDMRWTRALISIALVTCTVASTLSAESPAERRKAETLKKADQLFGQRYSPPAGKPLRLYDEKTETGPPDEVIFWHGATYVLQLIFADDGSLASIQLSPEALLHSDNWSDTPEYAELSRAEMQSLLEAANSLQSLGKPVEVHEAPDACFQSGPNLYCHDIYEQASVSHYHLEKGGTGGVARLALRDVSILYRRSVSGVVEDVKVDGSQRKLKIGGHWYHGEKPGSEVFRDAAKGSVVQLVVYGCTANEKSCLALPEGSTN